VRAQDAADPADGDPHLVHRVVVLLGEPYPRVVGEELLELPAQVRQQDVAGGTGGGVPAYGHDPVLQRPRQLGGARRLAGPGLAQAPADAFQHLAGALDGLDLQLAPAQQRDLAAVAAEAAGVHGVVRQLGEDSAVLGDQRTLGAVGLQLRDPDERPAADVRRDERG
jgi:hypothetical protein